MSDSEENFRLDDVSGSESDGYKPAAKKGKTAPKAGPKATVAKPAARVVSGATRKKAGKVLKDTQEKGHDSADDLDFGISDDDAGQPMNDAPSKPAKNKSVSEMYQKFTPIEHILKRPDSYIGSVEKIKQRLWTFDSATKRMTFRDVTYVPGFYKIVDEILVNAADNKINDKNMDTLKVTIDVENNLISVWNNGRGIPIEVHSGENMYIPEMIFGNLLTSSNYDDDEKKLTGGRNGYGAKLTNIYSLSFTIDTADSKSKQKYKQTWTDNMSVMGKAKITKSTKGEDYTCVTFQPDLKRFGMTCFDDDICSLLKKRVYDMAGTVKDIKVFLNDERVKVKNFKQYVEMYLDSATAEATEASGGAVQARPLLVYEQVNPRWEIAFAVSDGTPQQVSFANSIATTKGGTHVAMVADQIAKKLVTAVEKKNKGGAAVKPAQMKNHMWIFVNALIENPTFDSQTKEQLTLSATKFGSKPSLSDDFMKKGMHASSFGEALTIASVAKSDLIENILSWARFRADRDIKKTDGAKRTRLSGMIKLSDANNAGGRNASKCTLILTEGDSAKGLATSGLAVVGRDNFGIFPLKGKLLNVREAKHETMMKNDEIQAIKKIVGLQHNKQYTSVDSLRYGSIMIMADQDHDGSHIKGLLINFLDFYYPSLLKIPGFLVEFVTPIVRVTKGAKHHDFFTLPEYEQWIERTADAHRWATKYYKGLGTNKLSDGRDYFRAMEKHMIPFAPADDDDKIAIDLAFSKKKADERKEWLRQFKPGTFLDHSQDEIQIVDFINKELILFSMADNIRSIPSVIDGLKPGQRKVLWGCFKKKLKSEIKVAQLVGYISENAAYHHGENSLAQTIISLAQDFVGSNNVNLMKPNGIFGTRETGGKDAASPRYIFTDISPITRKIFNPADENIIKFLREDNAFIEPEWYIPVVPVVLLNGVEGIGTGWSTSIPSYNPADIVANIRRCMRGEEQEPMTPWWRGYTGTIKKLGDHRFDVSGIAKKVNDTTVDILELPIFKWTQVYKGELEAMIENEKGDGPKIKDYKEHHTFINVHFSVTLSESEMQTAEQKGLEEYFKLTTKINTSNMMCFDPDGKIKKYDSPEHIIEEFYPVRLAHYQKRKDFLANDLQMQMERLNNQARFVQMIVQKELIVSNRKKADIVTELRKKEFTPFPKAAKAKAAGETEPAVEDEDQEADAGLALSGLSDFDYLLGMPIWSLTKEKIEKLRQEGRAKEEELKLMLATPPLQMWNDDLDQFLHEWEQIREGWAKESDEAAGGKPGKRKQATLKTRKSLGKDKKRKGGPGDADDSEDDFKPAKAPAKKAAPADASRPRNATVPQVKAAEHGYKAPVKKRVEDNDSASDFENGAGTKPVKATASLSREAAPRRAAVDGARNRAAKALDNGDGSGEDDSAPGPPAPSARTVSGSTRVPSTVMEIDNSDQPSRSHLGHHTHDDGSDFDMIPRKTSVNKGKGKAAPKRKSAGGDDSEPEETIKPTKKAKVTKTTSSLALDSQPTKTGGGAKASAMRAKSPAKKPTVPKRAVLSDDEGDSLAYEPSASAPRTSAPKRAARGAAKTYIEIGSDDGGDQDESFVLS